jgi:hypothetical protein
VATRKSSYERDFEAILARARVVAEEFGDDDAAAAVAVLVKPTPCTLYAVRGTLHPTP